MPQRLKEEVGGLSDLNATETEGGGRRPKWSECHRDWRRGRRPKWSEWPGLGLTVISLLYRTAEQNNFLQNLGIFNVHMQEDIVKLSVSKTHAFPLQKASSRSRDLGTSSMVQGVMLGLRKCHTPIEMDAERFWSQSSKTEERAIYYFAHHNAADALLRLFWRIEPHIPSMQLSHT
jgi:hypothetical protein